jgi:hypothetical protein
MQKELPDLLVITSKNTMRSTTKNNRRRRGDNANSTVQHDHLPNGVRDNPGIHTL